MRLIDRYFLRQTLAPFVFFTLVLTGVMWLAQSLRFIDLIVENGQSAAVLLGFILPLLPTALTIVVPLAATAGIVFALNRSMSDSELVVVYAAGEGQLSAVRAGLIFAGLIFVLLVAIHVVLAPLGAQATRDRTAAVRSDLVSALIQDGRFLHPAKGLTVYIREANGPGDMRGVLVHDAREPDAAVTFNAQRGSLVRAPEGPRLVMFDGLAQRVDPETDQLSLLRFDKIAYDLAEFVRDPEARSKRPSEMFSWELLRQDTSDLTPKERGKIVAEAHEQLSGPLYGFGMVLVAMAVMLWGPFSRRGYFWRMIAAVAAAASLRVAGIVLGNWVAKSPEAWMVLYVPPVLAVAAALWTLTRKRFASPGDRPLRREPEELPA